MAYIKVNLPYDEEAYKSGNGEGVWVEVESDIKRLSDQNATTEQAVGHGTLANDSVYYKRLKCGDVLRFEMRGLNRAVVPLGFLNDKGRITEQELDGLKQQVLKKPFKRLTHGE
ncbi:hypothetical protein OBV_p-00630 (plasmid) [Oscillibacter valericigenes Sjm18-20]|nr:hypothetical protein OBV_p-00630 [Oscillibacter valericigenes Sjm18-20]